MNMKLRYRLFLRRKSVYYVSGQLKPASDGQLKTGHLK
jgi:hypothetical protein